MSPPAAPISAPDPPDASAAPARMHIVIAGHVDHGKSTVIGRLLADTGSLPEGRLEAVRERCRRTSRPFEYAFLLDALKDEQAQGITIDTARVFFRTPVRDYVILDAPGHIEFLKNMVTGASRAEAALLVIDAKEGIRENSRRHGYMVGMLGIRQLAVLVNKMDLVDDARAAFEEIRAAYGDFLERIGLRATHFIPIVAREGDNVAQRSAAFPWYAGPTVLDALDGFTPAPAPDAKPFRMAVQDVYKFTGQGDDRRIVAGTVEAGRAAVGAEVVFYPSGKRSRIRSFEAFAAPPPTAVAAGAATGYTLEEQIYVARGEMATLAAEPRPTVTTRLRVSLFWLGREPLCLRKEYFLKAGTAKVRMELEDIHRVIDASTLAAVEGRDAVARHEVAECTLRLERAVAVDLAEDLPATGRFVIIDAFDIRGGGIVREALPDRQAALRDMVLLRNYKWEASFVAPERRAARFAQRPTLVLITGPREVDRKRVAKELELRLFADGRLVYFLGIGNVVYGVDADLDRDRASRAEHIRRLAEVANLLLDAGLVLVASAADLTEEEVQGIRTSVEGDRLVTVWVGDGVTAAFPADVLLAGADDPGVNAHRLYLHLARAGVLPPGVPSP